MRVPEDLAIVGFDDGELAEQLGLTTVRQPFEESGGIATETLMAQLARPSLPARQISLELALIRRETTWGSLNPARASLIPAAPFARADALTLRSPAATFTSLSWLRPPFLPNVPSFGPTPSASAPNEPIVHSSASNAIFGICRSMSRAL
jgi:hypothetical protein